MAVRSSSKEFVKRVIELNMVETKLAIVPL
jgi:hypothetical protein